MGLVIGIIVVVVLLLLAVIVIAGYNGLVRARNAYKNAFAQIDVQLRRRFDLIPNLIETPKAYMAHERQTLEAVVAARGAGGSSLSGPRLADYFVLCSRVVVVRCVGCRPRTGAS
jgi:LemA protein